MKLLAALLIMGAWCLRYSEMPEMLSLSAGWVLCSLSRGK